MHSRLQQIFLIGIPSTTIPFIVNLQPSLAAVFITPLREVFRYSVPIHVLSGLYSYVSSVIVRSFPFKDENTSLALQPPSKVCGPLPESISAAQMPSGHEQSRPRRF